MTVLLVDDRDGRIVAELETPEDAQRVLEAWARDDGSIPGYLCLVKVNSTHGAVLGTDSSIKMRPLREVDGSRRAPLRIKGHAE